MPTTIMAKHNKILLSVFFCQACELLSALYGETAYEAADAYYYYGKAYRHKSLLRFFFCQACELLSALYGETAYEAADAYYYYGKALLEMARAEAGVFGNALDGGKLEHCLFFWILIV